MISGVRKAGKGASKNVTKGLVMLLCVAYKRRKLSTGCSEEFGKNVTKGDFEKFNKIKGKIENVTRCDMNVTSLFGGKE